MHTDYGLRYYVVAVTRFKFGSSSYDSVMHRTMRLIPQISLTCVLLIDWLIDWLIQYLLNFTRHSTHSITLIPLHSASQNLLCIPSCTTNLSSHSFSSSAPTIWNEFIHSFIPFNSGSKAHKTTDKSSDIKAYTNKHKNTERQTENTQGELYRSRVLNKLTQMHNYMTISTRSPTACVRHSSICH